MVKKIHQLNPSEVYPAALADFNLNTCGDPDCGNFGVAPDFSIPVFKEKIATIRTQEAAASIPALTTGLGAYTMSSDDHHPRISEVFEYAGDPVGWDDGRSNGVRPPTWQRSLRHQLFHPVEWALPGRVSPSPVRRGLHRGAGVRCLRDALSGASRRVYFQRNAREVGGRRQSSYAPDSLI